MHPLVKTPVKFGLIGSGILILMFFIFYFMDSNPLLELPTFSIFVLPVFIFFGIKEFRDSHNQHLLKFWEGMSGGLIIYLTIAVIYSGFLLLMLLILDDNLLIQEFISIKLETLDDKKVKLISEFGEESFYSSIEAVKKTSAFDLAADSFLKKVGIGFLLTSLVSTFLKKKKCQIQNNCWIEWK